MTRDPLQRGLDTAKEEAKKKALEYIEQQNRHKERVGQHTKQEAASLDEIFRALRSRIRPNDFKIHRGNTNTIAGTHRNIGLSHLPDSDSIVVQKTEMRSKRSLFGLWTRSVPHVSDTIYIIHVRCSNDFGTNISIHFETWSPQPGGRYYPGYWYRTWSGDRQRERAKYDFSSGDVDDFLYEFGKKYGYWLREGPG